MRRAGVKGEPICFIFDESNALNTGFLEHMNALLASGEVPGLFEVKSCCCLVRRGGGRGEGVISSITLSFWPRRCNSRQRSEAAQATPTTNGEAAAGISFPHPSCTTEFALPSLIRSQLNCFVVPFLVARSGRHVHGAASPMQGRRGPG